MRDPPQDLSRYCSLSASASAEAEKIPGPPSVSSKAKTTTAEDKYSVQPSKYDPRTMSGSNPSVTKVAMPTMGYTNLPLSHRRTTVRTTTTASNTSHQQSSTKSSRSSSSGGITSLSSSGSTVHIKNHQINDGTPSPRTPKSVHFTDILSPKSTAAGFSQRLLAMPGWVNNSEETSIMTETPPTYLGRSTISNIEGVARSQNQPPILSQLHSRTTTTTIPHTPDRMMTNNDVIQSPEIKRPQPDTNPPSQPFSLFTCGVREQVMEDPPTPTPYDLTCGLIQEEVSLLNKSQYHRVELLSKSPISPTQPSPSTPTRPMIEQPVHATWIQQQNQRPLNNPAVPRDSLIPSSQRSTPPPSNLDQPINLHINSGPPSMVESTQDFRTNVVSNPLRPSEKEVRELLNKVKHERNLKMRQQNVSSVTSRVGAEPISSTYSTNLSETSYYKPKLEPEEVIPKNKLETKSSSTKTKTSPSAGIISPPSIKKEESTTPITSEKSTQVEKKQSTTSHRNKSTMFLTRRSHVEANLLDNILPRPKNSTGARTKSSDKRPNVSASGEAPLQDLWNETRRQRYENLKGKVQRSLQPTMKISQSMQVESSSTDGTFVSLTALQENEGERKNLHVSKGLTHSSVFEENRGVQSSPQLPPRYDAAPRSEFWGFSTNRTTKEASPNSYSQRDRIEESRDGRDDGENESRQYLNDDREPPHTITVQANPEELDLIESMRGSPRKPGISQFQQVLGIPSLNSSHSPISTPNEDPMDMHPRNTFHKNDLAEKFSRQRQKNLSLPIRAVSAPRLRHSPKLAPDSSKPTTSTPENDRKITTQSTLRKKPSPATSSPGTPKLDQRTVRLLYAKEFSDMVRAHSLHHVDKILSQNAIEKIWNPGVQTGLSFVVRKRPMLEDEIENGDFDVVEAPSAHPDAIVLYEASILSDRRTRDLKAHLFRFDAVFSDDVSEEDFYIRVGQPYVMHAVGGGSSTFILVGGTRSGKTRMISEIEERAVSDIFSDMFHGVPRVSVRCLDLYENQCIDLLGPIGTLTRIVEERGTYGIKGAMTTIVSTAHDLLSVLEKAKRRFTTQTIVHRRIDAHSYFFSEIIIENDSQPSGCLAFVECPHGDQPRYTEKTTREETPFTQLMDNIQAKVSGKTAMTVKCNLTKLLQSKLETCVLGALSPGSLDTETTLSTLLSIKKTMKGTPDNRQDTNWATETTNDSQQKRSSPMTKIVALPRAWSQDTLLGWMEKKKLLDPESLQDLSAMSEETFSGNAVMRMTKMQLKSAFYDGMDDGEKRAEKLFIALRAENDRVGRQRVKQRRAREKKEGKGHHTT
jgi:hypothetical protein